MWPWQAGKCVGGYASPSLAKSKEPQADWPTAAFHGKCVQKCVKTKSRRQCLQWWVAVRIPAAHREVFRIWLMAVNSRNHVQTSVLCLHVQTLLLLQYLTGMVQGLHTTWHHNLQLQHGLLQVLGAITHRALSALAYAEENTSIINTPQGHQHQERSRMRTVRMITPLFHIYCV